MKNSLKQIAYNYVTEMIKTGKFYPGMRLPEIALAKEIGISATPVREAYRQLASEGYLEHKPNCGMIVREIGKKEAFDLYELREAIETFCAVQATQLMNKLQTDELERLLKIQQAIADNALRKARGEILTGEVNSKFLDADISFHKLIIESSGNQIFNKIFNEYQAFSKLITVKTHIHTEKQVKTTIEHHKKIIKYIKEHNPEKSGLWMKRHIRFSRDTMLK